MTVCMYRDMHTTTLYYLKTFVVSRITENICLIAVQGSDIYRRDIKC